MSLALKVLSKRLDRVTRRKQSLKLCLCPACLLLLVGSQDLQIVLRQVLKALQERRDGHLVLDLELLRRCLALQLLGGGEAPILRVRGRQVERVWPRVSVALVGGTGPIALCFLRFLGRDLVALLLAGGGNAGSGVR